MDLLEEIARISSFSYIVDINPDGAYGVKNPVTGEWNGVVKQLMSHVSTTHSGHIQPSYSDDCLLSIYRSHQSRLPYAMRKSNSILIVLSKVSGAVSSSSSFFLCLSL